nr:Probable UDP-galactopyranose mutase [Klebsiella pneumoniae]
MNYCSVDVPYTRITEHKYFSPGNNTMGLFVIKSIAVLVKKMIFLTILFVRWEKWLFLKNICHWPRMKPISLLSVVLEPTVTLIWM